MEDRDSPEYHLLNLVLEKADACKALQLDKLRVAAVSEIRRNVSLLEVNNVSMPRSHLLEITARFVAHMEHSTTAWATALWPWPADVKSPEDWTSELFGFAFCVPEPLGEGEESDQEAKYKKTFLRLWQDTVFGEAWMRNFVAAARQGNDGQGLLKMATTILERLAEGSTYPEWASATPTILRGVVSLLSPVPGLHGSSIKDVQYLFPTSRTCQMTRDLGKYGTLMFNSLRTSEAWARRREDYMKFAGGESGEGPRLRDMMVQASLLKEDSAAAMEAEGGPDGGTLAKNDKMDLLRNYLDYHPAFKLRLRPGALLPLEEALLYILRQDWSHAKEDPAFMASAVPLYTETLRLMEAPGSRELLQQMEERLSQMQFQDAQKAFKVALEGYMASPSTSELAKLVAACKGIRGVEADAMDKQNMTLWGEAVLKATQEFVFPEDASKSKEMAEVYNLVQLTVDSPAFANVPSAAVLKHFLSEWASMLRLAMDLCDMNQQFQDMMGGSSGLDPSEKAKLCEAYVNAFTSAPGTVKDKTDVDQAYNAVWNDFLAAVHKYIQEHHHAAVREAGHALLCNSLNIVGNKAHDLHRVAGGASAGALWDAGFVPEESSPNAILDHYKKTLALVDFSKISSLKAAGKKVLMVWEQLCKKVGIAFPDVVQEVMDKAPANHAITMKRAIRRAEVTNLEVLVCQAFLKSKKPMKRITEVLAQFSQDWKCDATEQLSAALKMRMDAESGG